jgi:hypothetical protein
MKNLYVFSLKVFFTSLFSVVVGTTHSQTTVPFTSQGTTTWTVPAGVTSVKIECWGAGGAGGGAANANNSTGKGGGGGAYARVNSLTVVPGQTLTVTVGAGGSGANAANGGSGGNSQVVYNSTAVTLAVGGGGGAIAQGNNGGTASNGGSSGSCIGDIVYNGGNGGGGGYGGGGGGGGGAGTDGSGNNGGTAGSTTGAGAGSGGTGGSVGGGNGGNGGAYKSSNGSSGSAIGGGGGGAKSGEDGEGNRKGGDGGRGEVRITYSSCAIPGQPTSISGTLAVCGGTTQTYSVTNDPVATSYTWTLPSGWSGTSTTNSISATVGTTGGTITVVANGSCGNSSSQTINVTVSNGIPSQQVTINGNLTVCANANQTYTTPSNPNATSYTWTLPSGWSGTSTTNSINATVGTTGGTVTVTANNTCGSSTPQTATINVTNIDNTVDLTGLTLTANQAGATYQWLDCNNGNTPISGETNQSFTPAANGNYAVEITLNGCMETSSCTVVNSVGITETSADNLTIFPNPGNGIYTISNISSQGNIRIKIYTAEGKIIFQESSFSETDITVDISSHPQGVYLLEIDNQQSIAYSKIVRQ